MVGVNNPEVDANWRIPESLWERVEPLLPTEGPKPKGGRPRASARQCMDGVFYVLRTGCQWKALPRCFGPASTVHDRFQEWRRAGVFEMLWQAGLVDDDRAAARGPPERALCDRSSAQWWLCLERRIRGAAVERGWPPHPRQRWFRTPRVSERHPWSLWVPAGLGVAPHIEPYIGYIGGMAMRLDLSRAAIFGAVSMLLAGEVGAAEIVIGSADGRPGEFVTIGVTLNQHGDEAAHLEHVIKFDRAAPIISCRR